MNEVKINKNEIESIWEKDNLCFIKMKSGKVWLCEIEFERPKFELLAELGVCCPSNEMLGIGIIKTAYYIEKSKRDFITIPLAQKGKSDKNA